MPHPHFEALCHEFDEILPGLGIVPWDPTHAVSRYKTASHGEKLVRPFRGRPYLGS
jgi:hypothetical protein